MILQKIQQEQDKGWAGERIGIEFPLCSSITFSIFIPTGFLQRWIIMSICLWEKLSRLKRKWFATQQVSGRDKSEEQDSSFPAWCPHDINLAYSSATAFFMTLGESFGFFILLTLKCMINLSFLFKITTGWKTPIGYIHGWSILSHKFFAGENILFSALLH